MPPTEEKAISSLRSIDVRLIDDLVDFVRGRGYILEVAIDVEVAKGTIDTDRVKDRGHRSGHEFAHGKDRPAHPERRQKVEHIL